MHGPKNKKEVSEAWAYIFFNNWCYLYFTTRYFAYNSLLLRFTDVLIVHVVGWGGQVSACTHFRTHTKKNRMSFVTEWLGKWQNISRVCPFTALCKWVRLRAKCLRI